MLQAQMFGGLLFGPFTLWGGGLHPAEVGIGRRDVVWALVIVLVFVMLDRCMIAA